MSEMFMDVVHRHGASDDAQNIVELIMRAHVPAGLHGLFLDEQCCVLEGRCVAALHKWRSAARTRVESVCQNLRSSAFVLCGRQKLLHGIRCGLRSGNLRSMAQISPTQHVLKVFCGERLRAVAALSVGEYVVDIHSRRYPRARSGCHGSLRKYWGGIMRNTSIASTMAEKCLHGTGSQAVLFNGVGIVEAPASSQHQGTHRAHCTHKRSYRKLD
mmetsp:Transcript_105067/g.295895  ORF Transcript_105067/g.295895 Transcript_105067/m.295895 type:complete len:215 (-) Transcript_105067:35-679(-)